ncbi:MAG TPA: ribonuclease Z [Nitrososphaerales archaeon]|nr:ribonuclease Z [Nitrososphaerales archaeon]
MVASITFYGTSSAIPSRERGFSCIGLSESEAKGHVLLDCGDGSIRNLLKFGGDVNSISDILVSHYHSDHITGITQVIETMGIRKRKMNLRIYGPAGLAEYFGTVQKITNVASKREFQIELIELEPNQTISFSGYSADTFEMDHTIPCIGYRITCPDQKILSYTGDTMPCPSLKALGRKADLFIHEATYLEKDVERARPPKHSTALEAATAAKSAGAKKLVLTHISEDHETPGLMTKEAKSEFENVIVAEDGLKIELG